MQPVFVVLSKRMTLNLSLVTHIDSIIEDRLTVYVGGTPIVLSKQESESLGSTLREWMVPVSELSTTVVG